jgi:hypothetical protein
VQTGSGLALCIARGTTTAAGCKFEAARTGASDFEELLHLGLDEINDLEAQACGGACRCHLALP